MDPMCGTGTIPIEAALMAENRAPGLTRSFSAEKWGDFSSAFSRAREEAKDLICPAREITIFGSDIDAKAADVSQTCARLAGVEKSVRFQRADMRKFASQESYGFILTNPPYGERLMDESSVVDLYRAMGRHFATLDRWQIYILTSDEQFESHYGRRADKIRRLYNGMIKCGYYQFFKNPQKSDFPRSNPKRKDEQKK